MSAPSIPNLLSNRPLGRGRGRSRGRGRGRGSGPPGSSTATGFPEDLDDDKTRDRIIQATDHDAAGSRLSATNLGYLMDQYAEYFYKGNDPPRRFPIINRGTYVRTTAIDKLVRSFLETDPDRVKQIISLGAGTDTRFFRLVGENPLLRLIYHEIDFPTNTLEKINIIKNNPSVLGSITSSILNPEDLIIGANGTSLTSAVYNIHPLDLRTLAPSNLPALPNLSATAPTLILSECCLIYLSPEQGSQILASITQHLLKPTTPVSLIIYEPIRPHDAFGRTMISNLASRGIHMQTVQRYENLTAQKARLRNAHFTSMQCAADTDFIWNKWISQADKEWVARCEMLDELEEWELLARHYCIVWGARDGQGQGLFSKAWKDLPSQETD